GSVGKGSDGRTVVGQPTIGTVVQASAGTAALKAPEATTPPAKTAVPMSTRVTRASPERWGGGDGVIFELALSTCCGRMSTSGGAKDITIPRTGTSRDSAPNPAGLVRAGRKR